MLQDMLKQKRYQDMAQEMFHLNISDINLKVGQRSVQNWGRILSKPSMPQRKYIIPEYSEMIPTKHEVKTRSRGQVQEISNTLRIALTDKLREAVNTFKERHKEPTIIKKKINGKLEREFEEGIRDVFHSYTKKNPSFGMPSNVHAIAITELRTSIETIKKRVAASIRDANPGLAPKKRWKHNAHLSKNPENIREGHRMINGKTIGMDEYFDVPLFIKVEGMNWRVGSTPMLHPHDINAPASQVISCHCECEYLI